MKGSEKGRGEKVQKIQLNDEEEDTEEESEENEGGVLSAQSKRSRRGRRASLKKYQRASLVLHRNVFARVSTLFPMGTPREIHSTEAATGHPPVWDEWIVFSNDASGLVGVDAIEFRVRAEAKLMGRSMDLGAVVLSMKEVREEALEAHV